MIANDLTTMTATPLSLSIGGEAYPMAPLTWSDWGRMQAWVDSQFPDPFEIVKAEIASGDYTVAQQQFLLRAALEQKAKGRRLIGTPDADERIRSLEGTIELLYWSIVKADPTFTREKAEAMGRTLTMGDIVRIHVLTQADQVLSDPKAETGTTTPDGTATTSSGPTAEPASTGGGSGTN